MVMLSERIAGCRACRFFAYIHGNEFFAFSFISGQHSPIGGYASDVICDRDDASKEF